MGWLTARAYIHATEPFRDERAEPDLAERLNGRSGGPSVAHTLHVIADDLERGEVRPAIAALPRANYLRRLARALGEA
jgi:hypothetical protein